MARPKKDGLEYFPLDVNAGFDDEVELLEAKFGLEGFAVYIKLLQMIYRHGYYINWSEKEQLLFSKRVNVTLTLVNAAITACLEWGLFDETLYNAHNILTSHGIQQRFLLASGRRKSVEMYREYMLLTDEEVNVTKTPVNVTFLQHKPRLMSTLMPQSKVKEIESKVKESSSTKTQTSPAPDSVVSELAAMVENTLGHLATPYEVTLLSGYLANGMELALIEKALQETAENGARHIKYTKTILNRCAEEKILSASRYELAQKNRKSKTKEGEKNDRTSGKEIQRSEAELIQLRRAKELGSMDYEDPELDF